MKFGGLIQSGVILFPKTLYIFLTSLITLQKSWSQKVIVERKPHCFKEIQLHFKMDKKEKIFSILSLEILSWVVLS